MERTTVTTQTVTEIVTTVTHTSQTLIRSTYTKEQKMEEVLEEAKFAFWAIVAGNYPGLPGDLDPGSTVRFDHECKRVLENWLDGKL